MASYGRDNELDNLKNHIQLSEKGSSQILVGGYGVGKSHLLEILTQHLLEEGYAVATLELGSSNERAEHPDGVVSAIERSFQLRIGKTVFSSQEGMFLMRRVSGYKQYLTHSQILERS